MAEKKRLDPIDPKSAAADASEFQLAATMARIDAESSWIRARNARRGAVLLEKRVKAHYEKIKRPHLDALKEIRVEEKAILDPLEAGFQALDPKILSFEDELRLQRSEAENNMQNDERQRALDAQEDEAQRLEAEGYPAEAAAVRARKPFVAAVTLPEWNPWLDGESRLERWEAVVRDLKKLVDAVAAGDKELALVLANEPVLNALANSMRQTLDIPGVEAKKVYTISQR